MMHSTGIKSETAMGALTVEGPQPVWMTLNEARDRAFTGEVVFEVDPEVFAYLDCGIVYYAERTSDGSLGRRLLEAGVVDVAQLERGTVRVGDVEHLGRLFDRDPSVDRDAVLVVTETSTEALIAEMANHAVATVRATAYRHHPSGVHRWFVTPIDTAAPRHYVPVARLDSIVVDDLPGLSVADADELVIEWDEHTSNGVHTDQIALFDPFRDNADNVDDGKVTDAAVLDDADTKSTVGVDVEELIVDVDDEEWTAALTAVAHRLDAGADVEGAIDTADETDDEAVELAIGMASFSDTVDDEFQVMWPDGSEHAATLENAYTESDAMPDVSFQMPTLTRTNHSDDAEPLDSAATTDTIDVAMNDTIDDVAVADDVPDDVAEAVRRAIAAIETASLDELIDIEVAADLDVDVEADATPASAPAGETPTPVLPSPPSVTAELPAVAAPAFAGFAPPTMDTSAEAVYAAQAAAEAAAAARTLAPAASAPVPGVASVVFVDDEAAPSPEGGNDRSSALRRLIGSLRRKDR